MSGEVGRRDWVSGRASYAIAWGIPTLALILGATLSSPVKTTVWTAALVWMGAACVLNALRCGRLHCYLTGPFFLLMAIAVAAHGFGYLWLGPNGWWWLGLTLIVVGGGVLWYLPERIWGRYSRQSVQRERQHV